MKDNTKVTSECEIEIAGEFPDINTGKTCLYTVSAILRDKVSVNDYYNLVLGECIMEYLMKGAGFDYKRIFTRMGVPEYFISKVKVMIFNYLDL